VAGRLAQRHPPGHDLGRQGPLGLDAAPVLFEAGGQFLAALDLAGEAGQI
jgi:hypothetical protein